MTPKQQIFVFLSDYFYWAVLGKIRPQALCTVLVILQEKKLFVSKKKKKIVTLFWGGVS